MPKILTVCRQGLSRSVGLADVLKLHFEPVDVIPVGHAENANGEDTLLMLADWADHIIVMQTHYVDRFINRFAALIGGVKEQYLRKKMHICDVGKDIYQGPNRRLLIDKVWQWTRKNQKQLGIAEHNKRL